VGSASEYLGIQLECFSNGDDRSCWPVRSVSVGLKRPDQRVRAVTGWVQACMHEYLSIQMENPDFYRESYNSIAINISYVVAID
jgi:hypothetical protein